MTFTLVIPLTVEFQVVLFSPLALVIAFHLPSARTEPLVFALCGILSSTVQQPCYTTQCSVNHLVMLYLMSLIKS